MAHLLSIIFLIGSQIAQVAGTCYFRDGTRSQGTPCGDGTNYCCDAGQACVANGLCRDINNHPNGSVTYFPNDADPGPYNYTGLYNTGSCTDPTFSGCITQCTSDFSGMTEYVWACNDALTDYCCHSDSASLDQFDCCSNGTFVLASAALLGASATSALTTGQSIVPSATSSVTPSTSSTTSQSIVPSTTSSTAPSPSSITGQSSTSNTAILNTATTMSSATATSHSAILTTASMISSTTVLPSNTTTASSSSLSVGATAGIAVGATLLAVALIGAVVYFLIVRRRKSKKRVNGSYEDMVGASVASERGIAGAPDTNEKGARLSSGGLHELDGSVVHEMDAGYVAELEARQRRSSPPSADNSASEGKRHTAGRWR